MSSMFSSNVVGLANSFAAGWANVGSGVTQLVMPLIYSLLTNSFQIPTSTAWRATFVVPSVFQAVTAILKLLLMGPITKCLLRHSTLQSLSNLYIKGGKGGQVAIWLFSSGTLPLSQGRSGSRADGRAGT
ncbi:hypothetical protein Vadar_014434 [Vaccinium darrowii]|uniref:Uncharacterized protein n=1 Tax=Vaccinium darrowii TaxID=229202 RepID=A0ACB7YFR6_9ERIC|nr:hypothetical protein Vadar_014434 [Vaccinium darrowii]